MLKKTLLITILGIINSVNAAEKALYDTVGKTYDATRCADPAITQLLIKHLNTQAHGNYIDVCCGSGNYTIAMHSQGIPLVGIDISEVMLEKARTKNSSIAWIKGDAHKLPYEDNTFNGALCINAIHHLGDLKLAFKETFRVIKPGSRLVIFTSLKPQCEHSWLMHYFPFIWGLGKTMLADADSMREVLQSAGFNSIEIEKFFVTKDTQDLYLYAGKYKPEIYLNQIVRDGMSPFNNPSFSKEIAVGLKKLEVDIASGEVHKIIAQHEKNLGENVFVIAEKK